MTRKTIKRTFGDALDPGQYDQLLALKASLNQTPPAQQSGTLQAPTAQIDKCYSGEKKNCSQETVSTSRSSTNQSPLSQLGHHSQLPSNAASLCDPELLTSKPVKSPRQTIPQLGTQGCSVLGASSKPILCEFCQKWIAADLWSAHLVKCKNRQAKCSYCHTTMTVEKLDAHNCPRTIVQCQFCGVDVSKMRLDKHISKVHSQPVNKNGRVVAQSKSKSKSKSKAIAKDLSPVSKEANETTVVTALVCHYCKKSISLKNYTRHTEKLCPKRPIAQSDSLVKLPNTCQDPEIAAYVARVAPPDKMGKHGKPQAKIRHGTYGLSNMEYDAWGRNE